ncbi:MAG TPA: response regulator [Candidatus Thermoplasmatota archaeon]|nr:response regulator [Candidatus Thermoplasmatota archaeon]
MRPILWLAALDPLPGGAAQQHAARLQEPASASRRPGPVHILVVDDEPGMLHLARIFLQEEFPNVRVSTAENAEAGLRVLEEQTVDLVVSDFRMPGMDGLEFLARVTQVPAARRILLTALSDPGLHERALGSGIGACVQKSLGPGELLEAVRRALAQPD